MAQSSPLTNANHGQTHEIVKSCEKLINQTQIDLELFRHEQNQLREQLLDFLEENHKLDIKLEELKNTVNVSDSRDDATRELLDQKAVINVTKQKKYLEAENSELRALNLYAKRTIQNLETELENYRSQLYRADGELDKDRYKNSISLLESSIQIQKAEISKQNTIIENLLEQKGRLRQHVTKLEKSLEDKESELTKTSTDKATNEKLQMQLHEAALKHSNLEEKLNVAQRLVEERLKCEKEAQEKVQEALHEIEAAVADKENAIRHEQVTREEYEHLASIVGQVMEQAAKEVDESMEMMRSRYLEKEKNLVEIQAKLNEEIQNMQKCNEIVTSRCDRLEARFKESLNENIKLKQELQKTWKKLDETQLNLHATKNLLKDDLNAKLTYVLTNKEWKEKYQVTIKDITKRFEKEIHRLQNENMDLRAENKLMKVHNKLQKKYISDCEGSL